MVTPVPGPLARSPAAGAAADGGRGGEQKPLHAIGRRLTGPAGPESKMPGRRSLREMPPSNRVNARYASRRGRRSADDPIRSPASLARYAAAADVPSAVEQQPLERTHLASRRDHRARRPVSLGPAEYFHAAVECPAQASCQMRDAPIQSRGRGPRQAIDVDPELARESLAVFRRQQRTWPRLGVQAIFNGIGAWTLLTWDQQFVDAGLASVLNSTSPIFVFLCTALITRHEPLGGRKLLGAVIGLAGVVLIVGADVLAGLGSAVAGQVACLVGAMLYACAARRAVCRDRSRLRPRSAR